MLKGYLKTYTQVYTDLAQKKTKSVSVQKTKSKVFFYGNKLIEIIVFDFGGVQKEVKKQIGDANKVVICYNENKIQYLQTLAKI